MGPLILYKLGPYKKVKIWTQTHIHVKKQKAKHKVMCLQAKEAQGLPANCQKLGESHGTGSSPQPSAEPALLTFWSCTSSFQNCEVVKFCCLNQTKTKSPKQTKELSKNNFPTKEILQMHEKLQQLNTPKGAVVGWWFITLLLCGPGP